MKGLLQSVSIVAVLSLALLASPVFAVEGMVFDWGPDCYGWEADYNLATHMSTAGSDLTIVGTIDVWYDPFLGVVDQATNEYTIILKDLVSLGSYESYGYVFTDYSGGTFEIYEDAAKNADFGINPANGTVPSTFVDGTLILSGPLAVFNVWGTTGPGGYAASYTAEFEFTGPGAGPFYSLVEGCYGITGNNWSDDPGLGIPTGYNFIVDGFFSVDDCRIIDTEETNWGGVKQLFR